jgi:hypothetical protein
MTDLPKPDYARNMKLIGHPHRSKYFDKALKHIRSRQEVWVATGSEILDWYKAHYAKDAPK